MEKTLDIPNELSEKKQIEYLREYPDEFMYIDKPSKKVQLAAVSESPNNIEHIDNPCEEVQLASVMGWPDSIQYIDNPTDKVKLVSLKTALHCGDEIKFDIYGDLTEKMILTTLDEYPALNEYGDIDVTEDLILKHIKNKPKNINAFLCLNDIELTKKIKLAYLKTYKSKLKFTREEKNFFMNHIAILNQLKLNGSIKEFFTLESDLVFNDKTKKIIKSIMKKLIKFS